MKKSKCSFLLQRNSVFRTHPQCYRHQATTCQNSHAIQHMQPPVTPKQVRAFLGLVGYYRKFIKGFAKIAKPLTLLTRQQVKFDWTLEHHTAFSPPKGSHSSSTHSTLPLPREEIHCMHRSLQMTPVEHNSHKNTMVQNSQ